MDKGKHLALMAELLNKAKDTTPTPDSYMPAVDSLLNAGRLLQACALDEEDLAEIRAELVKATVYAIGEIMWVDEEIGGEKNDRP
jgi:hypothetical protein